MHVLKQLPASGQLFLFLQLHERFSLFCGEDKILRLCCFIKLDILLMQLLLNLMVFRLKILWRRWWFGKCFFVNFKTILPILVLTFWLNGGLNQIMFQLQFLLVFASVWAYDIDVLYPLPCNDFSYKSFALSNSSLLENNSDNLLFFIFARSFVILEEWFDFAFM